MIAMEGQCACGEVHIGLSRRPFAVHCCHCTSCQRETGSAFVLNGLVETTAVEVIKGSPSTVVTPSESGKGQIVVRCPNCHVALWSHYAGMGERAAFVRLGTLGNPADMPPQVHIFTRSKVGWLELPPDVPAFEVFYSRKQLADLFGEDGAARWHALAAG